MATGRRAAHTKRRYSQAARAKMSAARRGKRHPHKGHPVSASTRAKISAALRGRHHRGHPVSPATRAKISAALRARGHKLGAVTKKTTNRAPTRKLGPSTSVATRRSAAAALRRPALPQFGTPGGAASTFKQSSRLRRIKVGAMRGYFRHTQRVSVRRNHWFRRSNKVIRKRYFRTGRR